MKIKSIVAGALLAVFSASPSVSTEVSINPNQGGASGYECSSTEFINDHIPGRSCKCKGGWDSDDCKLMLAEVCKGKGGSVCVGNPGNIKSCECVWKKPRTNPIFQLNRPGLKPSVGIKEVAPVVPNQSIIPKQFFLQKKGPAKILK